MCHVHLLFRGRGLGCVMCIYWGEGFGMCHEHLGGGIGG